MAQKKKKRSTKKKHPEVTDVLRKELESMPAFTPLPGERELARKFGVTPITIRKSLRSLEEERRIYSIHRKGTFVAKTMQIAVFQAAFYDSPEKMFEQSFYRPIYKILEERKTGYNWELHYIIKTSPKMQYPVIDRRALRGFDGIVSIGVQDEKYTSELEAIGLPVVVADYHPIMSMVDAISVDGHRAGAKAAEIMTDLDHEILAFVGHTHSRHRDTDAIAMEQGVRYLVEQRSLPSPHVFYPAGYTDWDTAEEFTEEILKLKNHPTAFICTGSGAAEKVIKAAKAAGLKCPADVSVVSLSTDPKVLLGEKPYIDSLLFSLGEMGEIAVESLLQLLSGRSTGRQIQIIPRYIPGKTVAEVT